MGVLEFFTSQFDSKTRNIGQVECDEAVVGNIFVGLMQSMGMANPFSLYSKSSKAVSITKKNDKYKLVLNVFKPPIEITWTDNIPFSQITRVIEELAADEKKVGYINFVNTSNIGKTFQLGIS